MEIKIVRNWGDVNQTLGVCTIYEQGKPLFTAMSLERGWNDNAKMISCIPLGTYTCRLEYSYRFKKDLWEIKGVANRSECKFHSANYWYQLNGCIALGQKLMDINKDGYQDVTNSINTMGAFHNTLQGLKEVKLEIV